MSGTLVRNHSTLRKDLNLSGVPEGTLVLGAESGGGNRLGLVAWAQ
jgi:hypothetical protein